MQRSKPIILYLPGKCISELEKRLHDNPPSWNYKAEYFYYLINYLTVRQIQRKKEKRFPLNTQILSKSIVWNIDRYIKYLANEGFLKRDYYIIGKRPYNYWLNPAYLIGYRRVEINPGTALYKKIVEARNRDRNNDHRLYQRHTFLKPMWDRFKHFALDYDKAHEWVDSHPDEAKKHSYHTALAMMEDKGRRYFGRNNTNYRLDTNVTGLKSELLQFANEVLVSIDLANSQPFFLYQVLKEVTQSIDKNRVVPNTIPLCHGNLNLDLIKYFGKQQFNHLSKNPQFNPFSINEELLKLEQSVVSGKLYYDFFHLFTGKQLCELSEDEVNEIKDKVKEMIFAVFFSPNEIQKDGRWEIPYQKEKGHFASVYPFVYHFIFSLKRKDHAKLAILLQRIESSIFIDTICPAMVSENIIPLTKHDSVIVWPDEMDRTLEIMEEIFLDHFDSIPTFRIEQL